MSPNERAARALELFDDLADLAPEVRAARLAALHDSEPELAREVVALLAADGHSGPLDRSLGQLAATICAEPEQAAGTGPAEGQRIGGFTLREIIGRGGMGEVWLAERSVDGFEQKVALKLVRSGMARSDIVRRFVQERRILAELSHPSIARFIDGGVSAGGLPWYAMEFVAGIALTDFVCQQALDLRSRVTLLVEICQAVAYAQARLVVHRDLKPGNILVDADGRPHLLDFGIAKLLDDSTDGVETATGMQAMSPAYAAPEQLLGQAVTTATDVYALGLILYELITGELPQQRSRASWPQLLEIARQDDTERPGLRLRRDRNNAPRGAASTQAVAASDEELDTIVLMALRREPERRYPNAAALGEDLKRWLDGRPVQAQADSTGYRLRKFVRRHRVAVASGCAVAFALLAGIGAALWQAGVARDEATRAAAQTVRAEAEARRAEAALAQARDAAQRTGRVKDYMMQTFLAADPLRRGAGEPVEISAVLDRAIARIDEEIADDVVLQIDLWDDFGEIRAGQGRFDDAVALFDKALAAAEGSYGGDHPVVVESLINRGVIEGYRGRMLAGASYVERALRVLDGMSDPDPSQHFNTLMAMAAVSEARGEGPQALAYTERALKIARARLERHPELLAVALHNHATALIGVARFRDALTPAREAVEAFSALNGPDAPNLIPVLETLSEIEETIGDYSAAATHYRHRLAIAELHFPGDHPWKAAALTDLGWLNVDDGDVDAGNAQLDEAIAMYTRIGSTRDLMPIRLRGMSALRHEEASKALALFDRGLRLCRERKTEHAACDALAAHRAEALARLGQAEQALRELEPVLVRLRARGGSGEGMLLHALRAHAETLWVAGLGREALEVQRELLTISSQRFPEGHPALLRAESRLREMRAGSPEEPGALR
jgi:serine/threonine-protein kinase